ncbi:GNAT family N-acetyltransferase [Nocardioides okcheonensis]|uniref:GNAT family N-acetyltransferase n=1 Tax=Nocardioides okcheonensis TaxID=2894081 RepID=UPI001E5BF905|nr:GNAT family N-acetyltransferase [Nocardioides okcheonensis]UFN45352.1 GNAT family N-acetyltransferase [Nocardioides okcheonensis]
MDLHLRLASRADAEEVARVYVASWNEGFGHLMVPRVLDAEQVGRWSRDLDAGPTRWWLAQSGESVVGFAGTGASRDPIDPALGELDTIAVAPSAWRRGVGRRLMDRALDDLRESGYQEGILWTLAHYERGRTFYEATGWRASGEVRDAGRQIGFRRSLIPVSGGRVD